MNGEICKEKNQVMITNTSGKLLVVFPSNFLSMKSNCLDMLRIRYSRPCSGGQRGFVQIFDRAGDISVRVNVP